LRRGRERRDEKSEGHEGNGQPCPLAMLRREARRGQWHRDRLLLPYESVIP
jgi:hypothetical protein